MRITGGLWRGQIITVPKGLPVRPTTDRTREALFNILQHHLGLQGMRVLDLFSGTGIISLESLSRGAMHVTAVDKNRKCIQALSKLIRDRDINLHIRQSDAMSYLNRESEAYSLIFMDPPYSYDAIDALIDIIFKRGILSKPGLLVVEHDPHRKLAPRDEFLFLRSYGSSGLSFFTSDISPQQEEPFS